MAFDHDFTGLVLPDNEESDGSGGPVVIMRYSDADLDAVPGTNPYYLAQYVLAPRVLVENGTRRFVLDNGRPESAPGWPWLGYVLRRTWAMGFGYMSARNGDDPGVPRTVAVLDRRLLCESLVVVSAAPAWAISFSN